MAPAIRDLARTAYDDLWPARCTPSRDGEVERWVDRVLRAGARGMFATDERTFARVAERVRDELRERHLGSLACVEFADGTDAPRLARLVAARWVLARCDACGDAEEKAAEAAELSLLGERERRALGRTTRVEKVPVVESRDVLLCDVSVLGVRVWRRPEVWVFDEHGAITRHAVSTEVVERLGPWERAGLDALPGRDAMVRAFAREQGDADAEVRRAVLAMGTWCDPWVRAAAPSRRLARERRARAWRDARAQRGRLRVQVVALRTLGNTALTFGVTPVPALPR